MVEKKVSNIDIDYLTRRTHSVKSTDEKIISAHTRKCYEINQADNPKLTIEKPLSKQEQEIYFQVLESERLRNEGRQRRQKKKNNSK